MSPIATLLCFYLGSGGLLGLLGIPLMLRKVPPNFWYGFRTPRTLANPDIWYEANAAAGARLCVAGVVIGMGSCLMALVQRDLLMYAVSCLFLAITAILYALVGSFFALSKIPDPAENSKPPKDQLP